MSTFARVDSNCVVNDVISATLEFINSGAVGSSEQWVECALDHSIRGRYPGKGYIYDREKDEFFPPKPPEFPSWVWNNKPGAEGKWVAPKPFPGNAINKKTYNWDESIQDWVEIDPSTVTLLSEPQFTTLNMGTLYVSAPSNANVPPEI